MVMIAKRTSAGTQKVKAEIIKLDGFERFVLDFKSTQVLVKTVFSRKTTASRARGFT